MRRRPIVFWFATITVLAAGSRWYTQSARAGRCSLDGNRITPIHEVRLHQGGRVTARFCGVKCAQEWPDVAEGAFWQVRDEVTGRVIDATKAWFVKSDVIAVPSRQDRMHTFRQWSDAMTHIQQYNGEWAANPLYFDGEDFRLGSAKNDGEFELRNRRVR